MAQNPPPRPRKRRVPPKQHQVGDLEVQIKNGKAPPLRQWGMTAGSDPVAGWNTGDLAAALAAHTRGNFGESGRLSENMSTHPTIRHCLDVRAQVFTTCPLMVTAARRSPEALLCADVVREIFPEVCSRNVMRDAHRFGLQMGFSNTGIDWELRSDGNREWIIPRLKPWDPQLQNYVLLGDNPDRSDGGCYLATTLSHGQVRVAPTGGRWLQFENGSLRPWLNGYVLTLGETWLGDMYNFRDNLAFQDRFGRGILKLFVPSSMRDEEANALADSIVYGGGGGVVPLQRNADGTDGMDLDLVKADGTGHQSFNSTEMRILRRILITYLGQDSMSMGMTGGFKQVQIHKEVLWNKREDDAEMFGDARLVVRYEARGRDLVEIREWAPSEGPLRRDLWWWFAYLNFGDGELAPYTWWDASPPEDAEVRAKARAEQGGRHAKALADLSVAAEKLKLKPDQVEYLAEQIGLSLHRPPEEDPRVRKMNGRNADGNPVFYSRATNGASHYRSAAPRSLSWDETRRLYLETSAEESLALR